MQEVFQIQITEGPHTFFMDAADGASIVDRDRVANDREDVATGVVGFTHEGLDRTAIRLAYLLGIEAGVWGQAVLVETDRGHTGLIAAQQVRFIERSQAGVVRPFDMIGCSGRAGPLFNGVWVNNAGSRLMLDRDKLVDAAMRGCRQ